MSLAFDLRLHYDRGTPVGSAKIFVSAHGTLDVTEQRDDAFRRLVRRAVFHRLDGGEQIPALRDAQLLQWSAAGMILTGVEEVADDKLDRPRLYAQTWRLVPAPYEELMRADRKISRLIGHLRRIGVPVEMLPGGDMHIPGEPRPDGEDA
jgi:hypothetical protein